MAIGLRSGAVRPMLAIPSSRYGSPIDSLTPRANADSRLCLGAGSRDAEEAVVSFRAEKKPKNNNYYDRSRYMYENKDNIDQSPDKIQTFAPHSTAVERHFMPSVRAFAGSGAPFRAMVDLRAPHGRAAHRSRSARAIRPCRPGVEGKAEPRGRLAATRGRRAGQRSALGPTPFGPTYGHTVACPNRELRSCTVMEGTGSPGGRVAKEKGCKNEGSSGYMYENTWKMAKCHLHYVRFLVRN